MAWSRFVEFPRHGHSSARPSAFHHPKVPPVRGWHGNLFAGSLARSGRCRAPGRGNSAARSPGLQRTLLFAGRLVARKGLSWFVRDVLPNLPGDVRLAVAGTHWDRSETAALDDPRVDFLGPLGQDDLHRHMAGALAVVIPNIRSGSHQFEGFGLIAAEAAAAGGIVLAARIDGYETSVIDGETGTLIEPQDAKAWVKAITDLIALPESDLLQRRALARESALRHFDWERTAAQTAGLFLR